MLSGFGANANGFSSLKFSHFGCQSGTSGRSHMAQGSPCLSLVPLSRGLEPEQPSHKVWVGNLSTWEESPLGNFQPQMFSIHPKILLNHFLGGILALLLFAWVRGWGGRWEGWGIHRKRPGQVCRRTWGNSQLTLCPCSGVLILCHRYHQLKTPLPIKSPSKVEAL